MNIQQKIQDNYSQQQSGSDLTDHDYRQMYDSLKTFIVEEIYVSGFWQEWDITLAELKASEPNLLIQRLMEYIKNEKNLIKK